MVDLMNIGQIVITHALAATLGVLVTVAGLWKKYGPAIVAGAKAAENAYEHLKQNHAAVDTVQVVEQAATLQPGTDPAVRDALVQLATRDALDAMKIELTGALTDPIERRAVIQFVQSSPHVPEEAKAIFPGMLDSVIQTIQANRLVAQSHDAIKAAETLNKPQSVAQSDNTLVTSSQSAS